MCIGNELRSDDGIGLVICRELTRSIRENIDNVRVIECPYGLELCTDIVIEFKPDTILIIDAISANLEPGSIVFTCSLDEISDYTTISTHTIPINVIINYIKSYVSELKRVCLLGIQVKNTNLGDKISLEVKKSGEIIVSLLLRAFQQ